MEESDKESVDNRHYTSEANINQKIELSISDLHDLQSHQPQVPERASYAKNFSIKPMLLFAAPFVFFLFFKHGISEHFVSNEVNSHPRFNTRNSTPLMTWTGGVQHGRKGAGRNWSMQGAQRSKENG
ncbi:hypothetical protein ACJRO7_004724 [Eucalyptus globulus]|uniref:Uncharacterized protein n=1 Tax=Eucalyptus globulus TaxID=34317 RepID=A0ABD3IXX3_EUCGL